MLPFSAGFFYNHLAFFFLMVAKNVTQLQQHMSFLGKYQRTVNFLDFVSLTNSNSAHVKGNPAVAMNYSIYISYELVATPMKVMLFPSTE
jgi:hypothetical protein